MENATSNDRWTHVLGAILLIAMLVNLYLIFMFAPEESSMGQVQRIFYFHVPLAWVGGLAFFILFISGILFLRRKDRKYDIVGQSAGEVGVIFVTLNLITGAIWARPAWNVWWDWSSMRLTLLFVLWFLYVGYLMLRHFVDDQEKGARFAAVYGIIAFADVPIVYASIRLWRDIHPSPVIAGGEGSGLHPDMRIAFYFSVFTFTLLFIYILIQRIRLQKTRVAVDELKKQLSYVNDPISVTT